MNVVPSERAFDLGLESCSKCVGRVVVSDARGSEESEVAEADMMGMKRESEREKSAIVSSF